MGATIRCFIAVDLSEAVRKRLGGLIRELGESGAEVGWVRPESIHLTLKFLGNVAVELTEEMKPVLRRIGEEAIAFRIEPAGCGAFPNVKQPRVVWVGLGGVNKHLAALQKAVESAMIPFGFAPEDRPFRPHLTLGRVRGRRNILALQQILLARQGFTAEPFDVAELV
ncbi:MAG: RNA 2',3'-cyclic phosphodiesterase, partial [Desulfobacteraceae bacterium]|nr:RNA 2',3'-cyclic phosphodiesterase [Desulfobacteraceae bacterium]